MSLNNSEAKILFEQRKICVKKSSINFPAIGEFISLDLESSDGRFQFQLDINRKTFNPMKITYQNRYNKVYVLRRLDFGGGHKNPPENPPTAIFHGYEGAILKEPHMHFYFEGFSDKWALPLTELSDKFSDKSDFYEIMEEFFVYCNISLNDFTITKSLFYDGGKLS